MFLLLLKYKNLFENKKRYLKFFLIEHFKVLVLHLFIYLFLTDHSIQGPRYTESRAYSKHLLSEW